MIKCEVNKRGLSLEMRGELGYIIVETARILNSIYKGIESDDGGNDARELWRKNLIKFLTDPDSPLFEIDEKCADAAEDGDEE